MTMMSDLIKIFLVFITKLRVAINSLQCYFIVQFSTSNILINFTM